MRAIELTRAVLRKTPLPALDASSDKDARDACSRSGAVQRCPARSSLPASLASLLGVEKEDVEADAPGAAQVAAERFGAVVALKGSESWIAEPGTRLHHFDGGSVGLATSGSGDTLAGIIAGLAARGAPAADAAMWGVYLHAVAGSVLARRMRRIGFLARELLDEIPGIMDDRKTG